MTPVSLPIAVFLMLLTAVASAAAVGTASSSAPVPADTRPLAEFALRQLSLGQPVRAADIYSRIVAAAPGNGAYWSQYAAALRRTGRLPRAVIAGREATRLAPADPDAWTNLGNALTQAGAWKPARAALDKAAALAPSRRQAAAGDLANLGFAQWQAGDVAGARRVITAALKLEPRQPKALIDFGLLEAVEGRRPDAVRLVTQGLAQAAAAKDSLTEAFGRSALEQVKGTGAVRPPAPAVASTQALPPALTADKPPARVAVTMAALQPEADRYYPTGTRRALAVTVPEAWPERVRLSPGAAGAIVLMGDEPTSGPAKPAGGPAADPADEAPRFRIVLTPLATSRTTAEIEMAVRREFGMIPAAAQAGVTYIKVNQGRARGLLISATDPTGTLGTDEDPFRGGGCVRMAKGVVRFDGQEWGVAVLARSDDPAVMAAANKVLGSLRAVKW